MNLFAKCYPQNAALIILSTCVFIQNWAPTSAQAFDPEPELDGEGDWDRKQSDHLTAYVPENGGKTSIRLGYVTGSDKLPGDMYYRKPGQAISGAITYAVDEVNRSPLVLPNHTLEFVIAETYGQEEISIRRVAQLQNYNISAYIGPQETCVHEGRIAAAFNTPMISYVSTFHCSDSPEEKSRLKLHSI